LFQPRLPPPLRRFALRRARGCQRGALMRGGYLRPANDFATSRTQAMKRSTGGLKVRFFNVTSRDGQGAIGNSSGSSFKEWRLGFSLRTEAGTAETKRFLMLNKLRTGIDNVVTACGIGNAAARNASMSAAPPGVSEGGVINTASARSARVILRRRAQRLCLLQPGRCGHKTGPRHA